MTAADRANRAIAVTRSDSTEPMVRTATVADADMLATLGARTFRETFAPDNRAEDMAAYMAHAYGAEQQRRELMSAGATFLVVEVRDVPAAYAYVRSAAIPSAANPHARAADGGVELARFYVDSPFHGRGVAKTLMEAVIAEAARRGAATLWLGVWERNARAIRFYTKSGFRDVGSHPFQLGSDLQRDRIMARDVPPLVGRVEGIWIKRMKRGPMDPVTHAELVTGRGIRGNANQGGRRQVTIIEREVWERLMTELGAELSPSKRRANLMVGGLPLAGMRGRVLRLGGSRVRIYGETRPCEQMDEALPGLQEAMRPNWGGGAFGEVLDDGEVRVGDAASFEPERPA